MKSIATVATSANPGILGRQGQFVSIALAFDDDSDRAAAKHAKIRQAPFELPNRDFIFPI